MDVVTVKRGDNTGQVVEKAKKVLSASGSVELTHQPGAMQKLVAVAELIKLRSSGSLYQYNKLSSHTPTPTHRPTLTIVLTSQLNEDFSSASWTFQNK